MESSNSTNKAIIGIVVIVLLVIAATAVIVMSANSDQAVQTEVSRDTPSSQEQNLANESTSSQESASYADGSYTAKGNYQTPGGQESIDVSVVLRDGAITEATVTQNANGGEAEEYQNRFASGFTSQVVGKKINEVSLSRIAGSSLTPNGFNNAIQEIKDQARA
jgi:uncharacterized protein YxeA